MAGDWIKLRNDLDDDPHVLRLIELLHFPDPDLVIGKLRRLWKYADQHTHDGLIPFATSVTLDRDIVHYDGFANALEQIGWIEFGARGAQIVRFEEHNGKSAKSRADNTLRQRLCRASVTKKRDQRREEKSREDKRRREKSFSSPSEKKKLGEESPNNPTCSEPDAPDSEPFGSLSPVLLIFPCSGTGRRSWELRESKLAEYAKAFPGVDVRLQARHALQWCRDNPAKRKTPRGMPAFLTRWFARQQDRGGPLSGRGDGPGPAAKNGQGKETHAERVKRVLKEQASRD